ncbi:adhesion G-protein coupled receptor G6-like [Ptychodera flava]|uniref:adhesion G-protein coupled receptor G6-like n=1 Tax=Ptychodera flava TaxID=63121 RepID=UPI00396A2587
MTKIIGIISLCTALCYATSQLPHNSDPSGSDIECDDLIWIGDDVFQIITHTKKHWTPGASGYCENLHKDTLGLPGRLAILDSTSSFNAVRDHLLNIGRLSCRDIKGYWIGCRYLGGETDTTWLDGSTVTPGSSMWFDGQPDNSGCHSTPGTPTLAPSEPHGCCQMWNTVNNPDDQLKIDDLCCTKHRQFICQFTNAKDVITRDSCTPRNESKVRCPVEVTSDDKGLVHWPMTDVCKDVEVYCPFSKNETSKARRECTSTSSGAEWGVSDTSECISQSEVSVRDRLSHLANIIPAGQEAMLAQQLSQLTAEAESFNEEDFENSVDIIVNILDSEDDGVEVEVAQYLLQSVENLLNVSHDVLSASQKNKNVIRLIQAVQRLPSLVKFDDPSDETVMIVTANIVIAVARVDPSSFSGLNFEVTSKQSQISSETDLDEPSDKDASSVTLPMSALDGLDESERSQIERAEFVAFRTNTFFTIIDNSTSAGFSPVIAAAIGDLRETKSDEPVKIRMAHEDQYDDEVFKLACVVWHFNLTDLSGAWSSEGCDVSTEGKEKRSTTVCECNRLSFYTVRLVLLEKHDVGVANQNPLSTTVYIVCGVILLLIGHD